MLELGARDALGDQLRARLLELGLRLHQVDLADDAGIDLVLHDLDGAGIGRHGRLEDLDALVGDAQRVVVDHQVGLGRQPRRGEIGVARLGGRRIALDLAADLVGGGGKGEGRGCGRGAPMLDRVHRCR